jgi:foldase protein PrsA
MKKLLSLLVLGAVVLAACGGGSGAVAATVDGTEITVGDIESLIDSDGATVTKDQFAQFLTLAIQWKLIFDAAEADYGVTVTDDDVEEEAISIFEQAAGEDQTREEFLAERGVTETFFTNFAKQQALFDPGISEILVEDVEEPTQEQLDAALLEVRAPLTNACVSHILVATEEEAADAMTRLEDGEEFGELAGELSTDTGSAADNGILPCGTLETYVAPFRDAVLGATVGEVVPEPVESQFGFHIILVTDRTDAAEEDLPSGEELTEGVKDGLVFQEIQAWFDGVMQGGTVTVDEEYGTWAASPPAVTPPAS